MSDYEFGDHSHDHEEGLVAHNETEAQALYLIHNLGGLMVQTELYLQLLPETEQIDMLIEVYDGMLRGQGKDNDGYSRRSCEVISRYVADYRRFTSEFTTYMLEQELETILDEADGEA